MKIPTILGVFKLLKNNDIFTGNFELELNFYILSLDKYTTTIINNSNLFESIKTMELSEEDINKVNNKIKINILTDYALEMKNTELSYIKNNAFGTLPNEFLTTLLENLDNIYKLIYFNINLPTIVENQITNEITELIDYSVTYIVKYDLTETFQIFLQGIKIIY